MHAAWLWWVKIRVSKPECYTCWLLNITQSTFESVYFIDRGSCWTPCYCTNVLYKCSSELVRRWTMSRCCEEILEERIGTAKAAQLLRSITDQRALEISWSRRSDFTRARRSVLELQKLKWAAFFAWLSILGVPNFLDLLVRFSGSGLWCWFHHNLQTALRGRSAASCPYRIFIIK